jgi:hypothetical protein
MFFTTLVDLLLQDQIGDICVDPLLNTFYEYPIMYTIFCHLDLSVVCVKKWNSYIVVNGNTSTKIEPKTFQHCKIITKHNHGDHWQTMFSLILYALQKSRLKL